MKTSATCPSCSASIGLVSVMRAPSPRHLSCGACNERLHVAGPANAMVLLLGLAIAGGIIALIFVYGVWRAILPGLGGLLVFEALASLLVVNLGRLEPR